MHNLFHVTHLKRLPPLISSVLILFMLAWLGCQEPEMGATDIEVGVPPSLEEETDEIAIVNLDAGEVDALHIETHTVQRLESSYLVSTQGEVLPSPEHFSVVSAPIGGRVKSIAAHEGEAVRKGGVLLELESLEYAELVADYFQAEAELNLATIERNRARELTDGRISAQSILDQKEAAYIQARANLAGSEARLLAMGLVKETIENWIDEEPAARSVLTMRAPIAGQIDLHHIDLGQAVEPLEELLTIVDSDYIMIKGYIPPELATDLRAGDTVRVFSRDDVGYELVANITTINPTLDASNRSVVVNILTRSKEGWPRPGTAVSLQIEVSSTEAQITIPLSAVQYEGTRAAVFVRLNANTYEKRFVEVGRIDQEWAVIQAGLEEGEEIAVSQVFNLKAMSRFEQFGEE